MTQVEEDTIDFWCASFAIRRGYAMTGQERKDVHEILIGLQDSGPTEAIRNAARQCCLNYGIVACGFTLHSGGAA